MQLIGNGTVYNHEGLAEAMLKHPSHTTFHKTRVSEEDTERGYTRFYRWHIDAALYDLSPPKVTTLYGITVPQGKHQVVRYDDGSGDELEVPLGTTAFVSGKTMFEILPPELKSLAVRSKVKYAPHPYVWMAPARANSTGLGIETEGLELPLDELPPWEESRRKTLPVVRTLARAGGFCSFSRICGRSSGRTPSRATSTSRCTRAARLSSWSTRCPRAPSGRARSTPTVRISRTWAPCAGCSTRCRGRPSPLRYAPSPTWRRYALLTPTSPNSSSTHMIGESSAGHDAGCLLGRLIGFYVGARRTSSCSTIAASCTPSSAPSSRTKCARSTSATSLPRMTPPGLRPKT